MNKVFQTCHSLNDNNSFEACIASILNATLAEVPAVNHMPVMNYPIDNQILDYLSNLDYNLIQMDHPYQYIKDEYAISQYTFITKEYHHKHILHSLVSYNLDIIHDPIKNSLMLSRLTERFYIIKKSNINSLIDGYLFKVL